MRKKDRNGDSSYIAVAFLLFGGNFMKLFRKFKKNNSPLSQRPVCIYGPPEMLEARRNGSKKDNDSFKPEENEVVDIYGPPEMLGALCPDDIEDDPEDEG